MRIENFDITKIIPYKRNNRIHDEEQIERIAKSILQFGFNQPIVVDENLTVLVGHGRLLAAQKIGLSEVPVLKRSDLTETQKQAYRILDNKLQNDSQWDFENLKLELGALGAEKFDINSWGLNTLNEQMSAFFSQVDDEAESKYTRKVEVPIYTPTGECPAVDSLIKVDKYNSLVSKIIKTDGVPDDIKEFLVYAAQRHIVFDYQKIAEFYAHASKDIQLLMEQSALVVIDFEKAIENGYVRMTEDLARAYSNNTKADKAND